MLSVQGFAGAIREKELDVEFVRGIAALGVVLYHYFRAFLPPNAGPGNVFGISADPPVLFAPVNGPFMVTVFFVLSSYVLSLTFVRENSWRRCIVMIVKRFPRLFLLTLVGTLLPAILYVSGLLYNQEAGVLSGSDWMGWSGGVKVADHLPQASVLGAVRDAFVLFDRGYSQYNSALWTLRHELIGSCSAIAIAALIGPDRRIVLDGILVLVAGVLALTVHPLVSICIGTVFVTKYVAVRPPRLPVAACLALVLGGLVLGSTYKAIPSELLTSDWIHAQAVRIDWFIHGLGAVLIFLGCRSLGNAPFERIPMTRTLGRLSFPFYVLHIPLQASIASAIVVFMGYGWQAVTLGFVASTAALVLLALPVARLDEWWVKSVNLLARRTQAAMSGVPGHG